MISKPFGKRLAELAEIDEGACVLDIGTGLGPVFFPAAQKAGEHGRVVGLDISEEMVRGTYYKIRKYGVWNGTIIQSDARTLIFKDRTFDVVLCGFSYRYSEPGEIVRVLKEGGRFGMSSREFSEDMGCMAACISQYVPVTSGDVSLQDTPDGVRTFLCGAGFNQVRVVPVEAEFLYRNEEQWWGEMLDSGWRRYVEEIVMDDPERFQRLKEEAFAQLQAYRRDDGIPFVTKVLLGFGTK
jgi:ubiquinone/menaquinone biosynthesis C-methylase UbiE